MNQNFIISAELLAATLNYLSERPIKEAMGLYQRLASLPPQEVQTAPDAEPLQPKDRRSQKT